MKTNNSSRKIRNPTFFLGTLHLEFFEEFISFEHVSYALSMIVAYIYRYMRIFRDMARIANLTTANLNQYLVVKDCVYMRS